ncbi:LysM domain-containing protein [Leucothrix sargassi]|nr:LysM domain-containing protein [Leucothrix sargassi]
MSFTLSRQILTSVIVLGTILLAGCNKDTIKSNLSSPVKPAAKFDDRQFDSYYGMPPSNGDYSANGPLIKRTVVRTKGVMKGTAPKRYKVRKGDTLWAIANKFLKDPWFWPEIWDKNQRITNPHLIYPGDVLYIYSGPRQVRGKDTVTITDRLVPQIRVERGDGIGEPISTLAPFLAWPRIMDERTIDNAPYIVKGQDAYLLMTADKSIYIKNFRGHAMERYAIFSKGKEIKDPDTGRSLGFEVHYGSQVQIEKTGPITTAKPLNMKREVRVGDRILNIMSQEHDLKAPMQLPRHKIRGTVMGLYDADLISGQGQIITINKGKRDGIKLGYMLGVYKPSETVADPYPNNKKGYISESDKVRIPPERAATAVVYNVSDNFSYALITKSHREVRNGYKIGNP